MTNFWCKSVAAISVFAIATGPALAETANQLTSINGAMGRDAERALQDRGFAHISTHKNDMGYVYSYWWDYGDDDCVQVEVYNGRVEPSPTQTIRIADIIPEMQLR